MKFVQRRRRTACTMAAAKPTLAATCGKADPRLRLRSLIGPDYTPACSGYGGPARSPGGREQDYTGCGPGQLATTSVRRWCGVRRSTALDQNGMTETRVRQPLHFLGSETSSRTLLAARRSATL